MSYEVSFDDVDRLCRYDGALAPLDTPAKNFDFHASICSQYNGRAVLAKSSVLNNHVTELEQRTQRAARIAPMGNVSGEAGVTVNWGGNDGPSIGGYVSGSASDDKGNSVDLTVEVNNDGTGSATVSASHDQDTGSSK